MDDDDQANASLECQEFSGSGNSARLPGRACAIAHWSLGIYYMDQAIEKLRTGIGGSPRRDDQRLGGRIIEVPDRPVCIAQ